jgi:hypothetical protein
MKKYLRLTCTTCKRSIDKLVDLTHYTPDQCTITLGCEGRLQPIAYISSAGIAVAPEIGITDWRPRGSSITDNIASTDPILIDLGTGSLKQLVIAVPSFTEPVDDATVDLTFSLKADAPKAYRQYVFRKEGSFTTISGIESGLEKKALRFSAYGVDPDVVEVFVNGVKREPGTDPADYQLYDGTSTSVSPPNTILFNTAIDQTGIAQVDVIVSKEQSASTRTLTFKRNKSDESRLALGAWENVSYIEWLWETTWRKFYLYTLDLSTVTSIPLNSILVPEVSSEAVLLLARKPYTQLDRYTNVLIPLSDMSAERDYIKYYAVDSITTARVTDTSIIPIFPPLRVGKFNIEKTIKTPTVGIEEQLIFEGRVIIGPDA